MLKKILDLKGAQKLTNSELKTIHGGALQCIIPKWCENGVCPEPVCFEINIHCVEKQCKPPRLDD